MEPLFNPARGEASCQIGKTKIVLVVEFARLAQLCQLADCDDMQTLYKRLIGFHPKTVMAAIRTLTIHPDGDEATRKLAHEAMPDGIIPDLETGEELARIFRRLIVNVIIHFKGRADPQREFDELALLVETALPPSDLGGLVVDILPTASEMFIDPQTAQSLGSGRVVFEVSYRTFAGIPDRAA